MASGRSVHPGGLRRKPCQAPLARASVRVLSGDILSSFVDEVERSRRRVQRLTIVSPWVTNRADGNVLERLLERAERDDAAVLLVTRPSGSSGHAAAISAVKKADRGRVLLNARLHAKLYLCEQSAGAGFAAGVCGFGQSG